MKTAPAVKVAKKAAPATMDDATPAFDNEVIKRLADIFQSLADRSRLKILLTLAHEEKLHVSAICERLNQSQPAVSHHLTQLRNAGLVDYQRDGKFNYYFLAAKGLNDLLDQFYPTAATQQQRFSFGDLELLFKKK